METVLKEHGGHTVACIRGEGIAFTDAQGALDFMHTLYYHTRAARIALPKSAVPEGFF